MLKLHGYPVSNYFNTVRAALIEKGLEHEIKTARASQDPDFLALNPMGKIPVLETRHGFLAETVAILEYLDDCYPERPMRPANSFERARARQIMNVVQLYVEAPARRLFPGIFFGGLNEPALVYEVRSVLDRSIAALSVMLRPSPFLFGRDVTTADLFVFYNLDIVERVTRFTWDRSLCHEIGTLRDWDGALRARASSVAVLGDFQSHFESYLRDRGAAYCPEAAGSHEEYLTHA